jgi:predicted O-linked N-acetylglucosamine transferase (SPINDLY family)
MQPYVLAPASGVEPVDEWLRLGIEAHVTGNLPLAQQRYMQALRLQPRHAHATLNLAIVFAQSSMPIEALLAIERAEMYAPEDAIIQTNKALLCLETEKIGEALEAAEKAVQKAPKDINALLALAVVSTTAGHAERSVPLYNRILDLDPKHPVAGSNSCFVQTLTNATPKDLLAQRQRWYAAHAHPRSGDSFRNSRDPARPLRVGYVGGDFKQHSAAFIFGRVVLHHTPAVQPYLYSTLPVNPDQDGKTKAFQQCGTWRDIQQLSDEAAANLIREDQIDILVDLAGHTNGGRLALFTIKPAPIQVTAWGFAHGTSLPEMDYFLADPIAIPEEERKDYAEKIWNLPCIVTFEPMEEYKLKGTSPAPCKRNDYFTFGCYARYEKLSDECLKAFAAILRRVPDSRLIFKDHSFRRPHSIKRVLSFMEGIEEERLQFSLATTHPDHMLSYQQCDLMLDPAPHGGGIVCLEGLYMGVPMITRYGTQPSGRTASSVLFQMGLSGRHVAKDWGEYVDKAVSLSEHHRYLAEERQTLRDRLLESTVVKDYHLAVEQAYREMWQQWCQKNS